MIFQEEEPLYCPFLSENGGNLRKCIASACALWEAQGGQKGYCGLTQGRSKEPAILDVITEE